MIRLVATTLTLSLIWSSPAFAETPAERDRFVVGLTLASIGGAAAAVAAVGSFAYIAETEHSGIWGWMALLAGGLTVGGGVTLAHSQPKGEVGGIISIATGVFSMALGIIGLSLQTPEAKRRNAAWGFLPVLSMGPDGERITMLGVHGTF